MLKTRGIGIGFIIIVLLSDFLTVVVFENSHCSNLDGIEKREFSCYRGDKIRETAFIGCYKTNSATGTLTKDIVVSEYYPNKQLTVVFRDHFT